MLTIITALLGAEELATLQKKLESCRFEDGRITAGWRAKQVKNNEQLPKQDPVAETIKAQVLKTLKANDAFRAAAFPRRIRPPLISRYLPGMQYGRHVDDALMGSPTRERSDIAVTVFLSDPTSYDGGELAMETPFGPQEVKLPAGDAVLYPASTLHEVRPVTRGVRLAAVTWVESLIRDPQRRELLHDLDQVRRFLHSQLSTAPETDLAFKSYVNFLRLWAET